MSRLLFSIAVCLIIFAVVACVDIYIVSTYMTILTGRSGGFLPIGALNGTIFLLPRLTWIILLALMVRHIRFALAVATIIAGVMGLYNGFWQYETVGYFSYDPDHNIRPSTYALLASAGFNVSLIIVGGFSALSSTYLQRLGEMVRCIVVSNRIPLYGIMICLPVLIASTADELIFYTVFRGYRFLFTGLLIVAVGLEIRRWNGVNQLRAFLFTGIVSVILSALVYLGLRFQFRGEIFDYFWYTFYHHASMCASLVVLGIIVYSAFLEFMGNKNTIKDTPQ